MSPLCQTQIAEQQLNQVERFFPLHVRVCESCYLVQLEEFVAPKEIFSSEYPYYSSFSDSWVQHAKRYCEDVCERFDLSDESLVIEIASNDGYLLQHFVEKSIPVLGIEPVSKCAERAAEKGVRSEVRFFGTETADFITETYGKANMVIGNNVLAHVPDINDFVQGIARVLAEDGVVTMEFPHLLQLMDQNQFDTIYHEHFSYLSFSTVQKVFAAQNLILFDVQDLPTHGGSLRIFATHRENKRAVTQPTDRVQKMLEKEEAFGLFDLRRYGEFTARVERTKRNILQFLISAKEEGKHIAGYGAPGKGNTLLNYCGIRNDFLDYTVDRSPHKYGSFTPGTRIPIYHPDKIKETRPDFLFILPWNLREEIMRQTDYIRAWGGRWVIPIPDIQVLE